MIKPHPHEFRDDVVAVARRGHASLNQVAKDLGISEGSLLIRMKTADIEDGMRAAAAVGDDAIQKQSQGRVMPDAFTHGTSEQRMRWFRIGLESGNPGACDTFKARRL